MKHWLCILLIGSLAVACQKEAGFSDGSGPAPVSSVRCTSCSYLPVCDSTQLTYIDSSAAGTDTIASTLAILGDTTIAGRKFTRISPSAIFDQGLLYICEGGDYRIYQRVPDLGISIDSFIQAAGLTPGTVTIPSHFQTTILKSGSSAGTTWSDTVFKVTPFPFFDVIAKLDFKLEQKGIQRTVLGKVYTNVIHVSSKLNVVIPLTPFPADIRVNYYFADNIGLIETSTANNGVLQSLTRLYRYKIK